ncbi:MAG TPA: hypothetical protein PKD97_08095 [Ferruginibacter sp.]|mgnify:FL=1|nr:hypothetical protein [Chitinophagaceae bacterium]HMU25008.1 hypothetical protein [Ferruginibacter sp.]
MKNFILAVTSLLLANSGAIAQTKPKPKEKAPTQKEMQDMMKEAQKQLDDAMAGMSEEDKRMMDSMGIKMPYMKKAAKDVSKVSDKQLATAAEDENRIVPKKDIARIASIPKQVTDARMENYIASIQKKLMGTLDAGLIKMGDKIFSYIQSNTKNSNEAGNMATGFWLIGQPQLAMYVLGKVCTNDAANTDNLSNYAAMLSMEGGEHLAIPVLNNLNAKFPKNSTLLNNLGQAWLGLGELLKAEKYLDSAIAIYPFHPQANMGKAAIAKSKGNTQKAKDAIKKSIQHAYTQEKEDELKSLGDNVSSTLYRLPRRTKSDALNLGGFRTPDFPFNIGGCIQAEIAWKEYFIEIDLKIEQLTQLRENAHTIAVKGKQQRLNTDITLIKDAQANPGKITGQFVSVPIYYPVASKKYAAYLGLFQQKFEVYKTKLMAFNKEALQLKIAYDDRMKKLRKEDSDQTGLARANEDYCPKYAEVSNKYLDAINSQMKEMYMEALQLKKEAINESAYYSLYMLWPDEFEVAKIDYQIEWLRFLKKAFGLPTNGSQYPFISITQFVCEEEEEEPYDSTRLQKFDDVSCQYKSELNFVFAKIHNNCSRMYTKLDLKFVEYTRYDDFERAEGDTYMKSTIKISAEIGKGKNAGPLKVEAKAGVGVEVEMDRTGVKDISLIGEVKVGAGTNVIDQQLEEHGNIAGKDVVDTTVEAGVEGRISIMSGQGSVTGTGVLSGIKLTEW